MSLQKQIANIQAQFSSSDQDISDCIQRALCALTAMSEQIPQPASGHTYLRWQILSQVAEIDLNLAKLFESHLDALAILSELGETVSHPERLHAVWAADGGAIPLSQQGEQISGHKMWCSGAHYVQYGLMSFKNTMQQSQLVLVDLKAQGIEMRLDDWHALGMKYTSTAQLKFNNTPIRLVGGSNSYLNRVGFWHGAAGVAACWYGACVQLARYLKRTATQKPHAFQHFYLGRISTEIAASRAFFQHVAHQIDQQPNVSHECIIRQLRAQVEHTAKLVLDVVGEALGAAPFCFNADFAQRHADLTVFIRQSHAAFDLAHIGELVVQEDAVWTL